MNQRIIIFVIILALFLTFISFNLDNRSNINMGFINFEDIPVFHIVFISFALGLIVSLPLVWYSKKKPNSKVKDKHEMLDLPIIFPDESGDERAAAGGSTCQPIDALSARERFLAKRNIAVKSACTKKIKNGGSNAG